MRGALAAAMRAAAFAVSGVGLLLAATSPARAHDFPGTVFIPPGETVAIPVKGHPPCDGFISISANQAGRVDFVSPSILLGVTEAVFMVRAKPTSTGSTTLTIRWGEDQNPSSCDDIGEGIVTVLFSELAMPTASANFPSSGTTGDPVNTFTGELVDTPEPDLHPGGPMDLAFRRTYASGLGRAFVKGSLGPNWRHGYEWTAKEEGTTLVLTTGTGRVVLFGRTGGEWVRQTSTDVPYEAKDTAAGIAVADPRENRLYHFAGNGRLEEIRDGSGGVLRLSYDGAGNLVEVRDHPDATTARALTFSTLLGRLVQVRERYGTVQGRAVSFLYQDSDLLVEATDAAGHGTTYQYDAGHARKGLLARRVLPLGNSPWTQTWDPEGRVATQTDAFGNTTTFTYGSGKTAGATTVADPAGGKTIHVHSGAGALVEATDPAGGAVSLETDAAGRRTSVTSPAGDRIERTWHEASGRPAGEVDGEGHGTSYTWTPRVDPDTGLILYDLSRIDHADGTFETFVRDAGGNPVTVTGRDGGVWTASWDSRGLLLSRTDPGGATTSWTRDAFGDVVAATDASGNTETFARDERRRLVSITRADGAVRAYGWDSLDRRVSVTDESGRTTSRSFDANGNLAAVVDPAERTRSLDHDAMDRLAAATDALGATAGVAYDSRGNLASRTDRTGAVTSVAVDAAGRIAALTDPSGGVLRSGYDGAGLLASAEDPAGGVAVLERDGAGRLVSFRTPLGNEVTWEWDAVSRPVRVTDPDGRTLEPAWDDGDRLVAVDVGGGTATASFGRDARGDLVSVTGPDGETWTLERDAAGRVISETDPLGNATLFAYDVRNRLSLVTHPGGLGTETIDYDPAGRIVGRDGSDGSGSSRQYDAAGDPVAADGVTLSRDARGLIETCNGIGVGRDAEGRIVSLTLAPGKVVTYSRDAAGRVSGVSDWAGGGATFVRDARGLVISMERSNGVTTGWEHDADGALVLVREGTLAVTRLERNGAGRVSRAERDVPLAPSLEAAAGTSLEVDAGQRTVGAAHDAMGRLTDDGTRTFQWDLRSRLKAVGEGAATTEFTCDAFGLLLSRRDPAGERFWTWNYATDLPSPAILSVEGAPVRFFIHDPEGRLLCSIEADGGDRRWYHFDEAGNTLFLTDDSGAVTDAFAWTPWGIAAGRTGTTDTPFTWQGRLGVMDEGGGLFRMRRRIYDAATRRFLTRDPAPLSSDPRALNPYAYALGDPLGNVDPFGETNESAELQGMLGNVLGDTANVVETAAEVNGLNVAAGTSGAKLVKGAKVLGVVGFAVSAEAELDQYGDRKREIEKEFEEANRRALKSFTSSIAEVDRQYRLKIIDAARREELHKILRATLEEEQERIRERDAANRRRNVVVSGLNLATNLVPYLGNIFNWTDVIDR